MLDRTLLGVIRVLNVIVVVALTTAVAVICALGALALTGVAQLRYELTGSMAPLISPGDLVVYRPVRASSVWAGQVVSFVPPGSSALVTHRIVSLPSPGVLVTKGDANASNDPAQVMFPPGQRVWVVRWVLPGLGGPVAALSGGHGLPFVVGLLPLFILLPWLRRRLLAVQPTG